MNVNFAYPFQLDINAPVTSTQYDLYNILQHEFTHAFGFTSDLNLKDEGDGAFKNQYFLYDPSLADVDGTKLLNPDLTPNLTAFSIAASSGVFFTGPNAEAAYGGQPIPLYAAPDADNASSASHTSPTLLPDDLMNPGLATGPAPAQRMLSPIDIGLLTDIGYTPVSQPTGVPEPGAYGIVLAGLASFGLLGGRRRPELMCLRTGLSVVSRSAQALTRRARRGFLATMPAAVCAAGMVAAGSKAAAAAPGSLPRSFPLAQASILFIRRSIISAGQQRLTLSGSGSATIERDGVTQTQDYALQDFRGVLKQLCQLRFFSMSDDYMTRTDIVIDETGIVRTNSIRFADAASSQICFAIGANPASYRKCVTYDHDGPRDLLDLEGESFRAFDASLGK